MNFFFGLKTQKSKKGECGALASPILYKTAKFGTNWSKIGGEVVLSVNSKFLNHRFELWPLKVSCIYARATYRPQYETFIRI